MKQTLIQDPQINPPPWYRQFWPWFLIALPASVVVAGIGTVILAFKTPLSLVEDDYYKRGLAINADLSSQELAGKLGIVARIQIDANRVIVDLNQGQTEQLSIEFIHPTDASLDHRYQMARQGARIYESALSNPLSGRFKVELSGQREAGNWRLKSEISVPEDYRLTTSLGEAR